jgi:hypothetical protein
VHLSTFDQGTKKYDGTVCAGKSWQRQHALH